MGKFLLLAVAAVTLAAGTLMLTSTRESMGSTQHRLAQQGEATVARAVAHSGMAVAESALAAELSATGTYSGPTTFAAPYQGGEYVVMVTAAGDEYTLHAQGRAGADTANAQKAFRLELAAAERPVPAFMEAGITVGNSLIIKDDFAVMGGPGGESGDVHSNNDFKAESGSVQIEGFVTYGNAIDYTNGETPEGTITPPSNPGGDPVHARAPVIDIPAFQAADHLHTATRVSAGNVSLSGTVTLGTRDAPVIWYINGDLDTTGDVTISGYGTIITDNTVTIRHHVRAPSAEGASSFALYAGNDLKVDSGSLTVEGQVLVGNSLDAQSNTTIRGSLTVGNDLKTNGPFTIDYRPASARLTDPFWPPSDPEPSPDPEPPVRRTTYDRLVSLFSRIW